MLGHVDGVGRLAAVTRLGASRQLTFTSTPHVLAQLLPKGSIAVDGVSLTLDAGPFAGSFTVTLIPETLRATRLSALRPGDRVNLEVDVLAKAARQPAGGSRPATGGRIATLADILARGWGR